MRRTVRFRATAGAVLLTVASLVLAACGSGGDYPATQVPTASATPSATAGAAATPTCTPSAVTSYSPAATLDTAAAKAATDAIQARKILTVGVSADSQLLAARNPLTNVIEGFDIDIATVVAKAMAKSIFNDENKFRLVVISASDRIPKLNDRTVDMVVRNMSMTCDRWSGTAGKPETGVAFSAEYYQSGLKLLVPKGSKATSLAELKAEKLANPSTKAQPLRVCAPTGTSTIAYLQAQGVTAVGAATHTGCLVLFQQGRIDAIAGDDTVLAGLIAQDPYAFVPKMTALTSEPYGIGFNKDAVSYVRYANSILEQVKADGRWKSFYDKWFAGPLGPGTPPAPTYGR